MAKLGKGHFGKFDDPKIRTFRAVELYQMANWYEAEIDNPERTDCPNWLAERARMLRELADKKYEAFLHKSAQKGIHF